MINETLNKQKEIPYKGIRKLTSRELTSPSHDTQHAERVRAYAMFLASRHEGDPQIAGSAAYLHDLGRKDATLHDEDSIHHSIKLAEPLLARLDLAPKDIAHLLQIISEHGQPKLEPSSTESQALKEADFLDGFGARGIFRTIAWTIESGGTKDDILHRLKEKMPKRAESLQYPESRRAAAKEFAFVKYFLASSEEPIDLEAESYPGTYIVIDGISGNGKDTQAKKLKERLEEKDQEVLLLSEPSPKTKDFRTQVKDDLGEGPDIELLTYTLDRVGQAESIREALKEGKTVIQTRSFLSTMVYQSDDAKRQALVELITSQLVPYPDMIINLDVNPEEAIERIQKREIETGKPISRFENMQDLTSHRSRFIEIAESNPFAATINGEGAIEDVSDRIVALLEQHGLLD